MVQQIGPPPQRIKNIREAVRWSVQPDRLRVHDTMNPRTGIVILQHLDMSRYGFLLWDQLLIPSTCQLMLRLRDGVRSENRFFSPISGQLIQDTRAAKEFGLISLDPIRIAHICEIEHIEILFVQHADELIRFTGDFPDIRHEEVRDCLIRLIYEFGAATAFEKLYFLSPESVGIIPDDMGTENEDRVTHDDSSEPN